MKTFEDCFFGIFTEIIDLSLDYCNISVDTIFIHCSHENNCISSNVFFIKEGRKILRNQISSRTSADQKQLIHSINEKLKDFELLCINNKQPVPTEIKLIYEISSKNLKSDFSYEYKYSDSPDTVVQDVFDEWFKSF